MERYSMFLGWKNQYCENDYTTKSNLQIQWNPYQITKGIFHRTRTKNFIAWKHKRPQKSQSNLEKEEWSWQNQLFWLQTTVIKIVWYWCKNRNIDQWNKIGRPQIIYTTRGTLSLTKEARIHNGAEIASSISGDRKTGQIFVKEWNQNTS